MRYPNLNAPVTRENVDDWHGTLKMWAEKTLAEGQDPTDEEFAPVLQWLNGDRSDAVVRRIVRELETVRTENRSLHLYSND